MCNSVLLLLRHHAMQVLIPQLLLASMQAPLQRCRASDHVQRGLSRLAGGAEAAEGSIHTPVPADCPHRVPSPGALPFSMHPGLFQLSRTLVSGL